MLLAAMYSVGLTILAVIEKATDGWGLGGSMFNPIYFGQGPWWQQFYSFFVSFLFFFFVGAAAASVFVRWKSNGLVLFFALLALLLIGIAALITFTGSWSTVGAWFVANGALGTVTWSLVLTVFAGIAGYLILRRATPRN